MRIVGGTVFLTLRRRLTYEFNRGVFNARIQRSELRIVLRRQFTQIAVSQIPTLGSGSFERRNIVRDKLHLIMGYEILQSLPGNAHPVMVGLRMCADPQEAKL